MDFEKIKLLANEYADLFIKSEREFMQRFHQDVPKYAIPEQVAVFGLANTYHACKVGLIDKAEVIRVQRDIRKGYEG